MSNSLSVVFGEDANREPAPAATDLRGRGLSSSTDVLAHIPDPASGKRSEAERASGRKRSGGRTGKLRGRPSRPFPVPGIATSDGV